MSDNPIKKTLGNDKFYKLSKNLKVINFIPNRNKPNSRTYVSHAIFEGDVDFGDEKIEWLGEKPESFPEDKVSIVELIQTDNDKIYAHVFGQAGASKDEVNDIESRLSVLENFVSYEVYLSKSSLPSEGNSKIIYLVKKSDGSENDYYDEYIWTKKEGEINAHYELIGNTSVNLSDYVTKTDFNSLESSLGMISDNLSSHTSDSDVHVKHYYESNIEAFSIGDENVCSHIGLYGCVFSQGPLTVKEIDFDNDIKISGNGNSSSTVYFYYDGRGRGVLINVSSFKVGPLEVNYMENAVYINGELINSSSSQNCPFVNVNGSGRFRTNSSLFVTGPLVINELYFGDSGPLLFDKNNITFKGKHFVFEEDSNSGGSSPFTTETKYPRTTYVTDDSSSVVFNGPIDFRGEVSFDGSYGPVLFNKGIRDNYGNTISDFSSLSLLNASMLIDFFEDCGYGSVSCNKSLFVNGPITPRGYYIKDKNDSKYYVIDTKDSMYRDGNIPIFDLYTVGDNVSVLVNVSRFTVGPLHIIANENMALINNKEISVVNKKTTWNTYVSRSMGNSRISSFTGTVVVDGEEITFSLLEVSEEYANIDTKCINLYGTVTTSKAVSKDELYPALLRKFIEMSKECEVAPAYITIID